MNIYILKNLKLFLIFALLINMLSCTDDFEELNTNPTVLTESSIGDNEISLIFSKAQSSSSYAFWRYQVAQNLFVDLYSQYFATTATYFNSDRNVIRMDWLQWHWKPIYTDVVPQLNTIFAQTEANSPENALAKVMWVYTFHRLTDYYGPIPYSNLDLVDGTIKYDSQESIYTDFFAKLDEAITVLESNTDATPYGNFDLIYQGDVSKWLKFANSLKLRLAMRVSNIDGANAKSLAEAAVTKGVFENISDGALMLKTEAGTDVNGLGGIAVWNEFRMSAAMESTLKGYNDPRIGVFFQPNESGEFHGLRNGLTPAQLGNDINLSTFNSNVGSRWVSKTGENSWSRVGNTPQNLMHAAEMYFIRAEGALKGWDMGGTAEELYNKGIESSMNQWGITDATAIANYQNSTATPIAPDDFLGSDPVSDAPIKWSSDADMQKKQLAVQKWLALFPDGIENWADMRRSDNLPLYPVANNENSDLGAGERPKRIPFLDIEKNTNAAAVNAAVDLLKGPDKVSTPLWWDE